MNTYNFTIKHLIFFFILAVIVFSAWRYKTSRETLSFLPQNDLYGDIISGKNHIDMIGEDDYSVGQVPPPYRELPMENNAIYITGMNKYLWSKSKKTSNI